MLKNFNVKDFLTSIVTYVIAFAVIMFIWMFIWGFVVNLFGFGTTIGNITAGIGMIFAVSVGLAAGKSIHADILVGLFLFDAFRYSRIDWSVGITAILFAIMAVGKWTK